MARNNQNLNRSESAALRAIAQQHGYLATRGPLVKNGQASGNATEMLLALISGELATVLLGDDERDYAIGKLLNSGDEVLESIGLQVQDAARREHANLPQTKRQ